MRLRHLAAASVFLASLSVPLYADVKLPAIFGDHMVLQRSAKVPVWGWADPNESVTVTIGESKATATADADGKWTASIDSLKASDKPTDLTVTGKNAMTLHDVLVGDVWVCSGQSNMEFQLGGGSFGFGGMHNAAEAIPEADHPTLRLFIVHRKIAVQPENDCTGKWMVSTPETAPKFSAVGYFFGQDILEDQKVPVGMIGSYWGGTPGQAWTSYEALCGDPTLKPLAQRAEMLRDHLPELKEKYEKETLPAWQKQHDAWQAKVGQSYNDALAKWNAEVVAAKASGGAIPPRPASSKHEPRKPTAPYDDQESPTVLSNGMIAPIIPFAIKGAIWYQGEANVSAAKQYETLFPTMITDWRTRWGEGNFPFLWVQLPNNRARSKEPLQAPDPDGWTDLRAAQSKTLKLPHTGQAVTIDIGDANNGHPKDKADVGHRLALAARHVAYGEDIVFSGPTFDSMQIDGDKIRIRFTNTGTGLTIAAAPSTQPGVAPEPAAGALKGFAVAGDDHKFVWADAQIDGNSIVVSSPDVKEPKAVRYGWASNPEVNLYNKEQLPASPFRTDDWDNVPASQTK